MLRFYSFLFILSAFFSACRKNVPSHVVTQVDGVVLDAVTRAPLAGVPVVIGGCRYNFYGEFCHDLKDSAVTDGAGHFSIRFGADGKSIFFKVKAAENDYFVNGTWVELQTRKYNNVTLTAQPTKVLKLRVTVAQNPYDTLLVRQGSYGRDNKLIGRRIDTVLYMRYLPPFAASSLTVIDRSIGRFRQQWVTPSLPDPVPDTLEHAVTVNNTADFPVVQ